MTLSVHSVGVLVNCATHVVSLSSHGWGSKDKKKIKRNLKDILRDGLHRGIFEILEIESKL